MGGGCLLQGFLGAVLYALHAQDAFCTVLPAAGRIQHIHLHGADLPAPAAGDAFARIALYPEQSKIAHGLQEHRYRADIFAEGPVILQGKGQGNPQPVIEQVPHDKGPDHDLFLIRHLKKEQPPTNSSESAKHT